MKPRIHCNRFDNWYGYLGKRRVIAFGNSTEATAEQSARAWLVEREAINARAAGRQRGYSRAFTPHGATGKRYTLDAIPAGLWSSVRARCKRDGVSVRAVTLQLLSDWVESSTTVNNKGV